MGCYHFVVNRNGAIVSGSLIGVNRCYDFLDTLIEVGMVCPTEVGAICGEVFWVWVGSFILGWVDIVFMALSHERDTGLGIARLCFWLGKSLWWLMCGGLGSREVASGFSLRSFLFWCVCFGVVREDRRQVCCRLLGEGVG